MKIKYLPLPTALALGVSVGTLKHFAGIRGNPRLRPPDAQMAGDNGAPSKPPPPPPPGDVNGGHRPGTACNNSGPRGNHRLHRAAMLPVRGPTILLRRRIRRLPLDCPSARRADQDGGIDADSDRQCSRPAQEASTKMETGKLTRVMNTWGRWPNSRSPRRRMAGRMSKAEAKARSQIARRSAERDESGGQQSQQQGGPGGRPPRPPHPPAWPLIEALDANHDGVIDADEIANATEALKSLDKNHDGKLTPDEYMPHPSKPPKAGPLKTKMTTHKAQGNNQTASSATPSGPGGPPPPPPPRGPK